MKKNKKKKTPLITLHNELSTFHCGIETFSSLLYLITHSFYFFWLIKFALTYCTSALTLPPRRLISHTGSLPTSSLLLRGGRLPIRRGAAELMSLSRSSHNRANALDRTPAAWKTRPPLPPFSAKSQDPFCWLGFKVLSYLLVPCIRCTPPADARCQADSDLSHNIVHAEIVSKTGNCCVSWLIAAHTSKIMGIFVGIFVFLKISSMSPLHLCMATLKYMCFLNLLWYNSESKGY